MKSTRFILVLCILSFIHLACIWDYDTLETEKQQFPGIQELISGKFLRHSPEFYEWRIKDRQAKLKKDPNNLAYLDDLAVAYSKTHQDKKAIELMLKKDKISPGLYETAANLGTFYIHDGQYEKGLEYIDKAIEINPDAHFGREIYQRYLVEYVLEKRKSGVEGLPLNKALESDDNFYAFLLKKYQLKTKSTDLKLPIEELNRAVKGISGMIKFGNSDSPVLMEALGDLLFYDHSSKAARQLAAFAYYRASQAANKTDSMPIEYKQIIVRTLLEQVYNKKHGFRFEAYAGAKVREFTFSEIKPIYDKAIREADSYFQKIRKDEMAWIAAGEDPEQKFEEKYYNQKPKKATQDKVPIPSKKEAKSTQPKSPTLPSTASSTKQSVPTQPFPILPVLLISSLVFGGLIFIIIKFNPKK